MLKLPQKASQLFEFLVGLPILRIIFKRSAKFDIEQTKRKLKLLNIIQMTCWKEKEKYFKFQINFLCETLQ